MAIYPFYTEVISSTRKTPATCGCIAKDGGMHTNIYQRDEGTVTTAFTINQFSKEEDGVLYLYTRIIRQGVIIAEHKTKY